MYGINSNPFQCSKKSFNIIYSVSTEWPLLVLFVQLVISEMFEQALPCPWILGQGLPGVRLVSGGGCCLLVCCFLHSFLRRSFRFSELPVFAGFKVFMELTSCVDRVCVFYFVSFVVIAALAFGCVFVRWCNNVASCL